MPGIPKYDLVDDVDVGGLKVAVVRGALELRLLDHVAAGACDVPALARASGCSERGVRVVVRALIGLGLLAGDERSFALGPTAAAYLVSGAVGDVTPILLSWFRNRDQLVDAVRDGRGAVEDHRTEASAGLWRSYAAPDLVRWPDRVAEIRARFSERGLVVPPQGAVLDLGCGSGICSVALLLEEPSASAVLVDRPEVLEVAAALVSRAGVGDRVSLVESDVRDADLRGSAYDVIMLTNVAQYLRDDELVELLERARAALADEGRLQVVTVIVDGDPASTWGSAVEMFLSSPTVDQRSGAAVESLLERAGFTRPQRPLPHVFLASAAR